MNNNLLKLTNFATFSCYCKDLRILSSHVFSLYHIESWKYWSFIKKDERNNKSSAGNSNFPHSLRILGLRKPKWRVRGKMLDFQLKLKKKK